VADWKKIDSKSYGSRIFGEQTRKFDGKKYKRHVAIYNEKSWYTKQRAEKKAKSWKAKGFIKSYRIMKEQGEFVIYAIDKYKT